MVRAQRQIRHPSAYLNRWRLQQWRELFSLMCPEHPEILDQCEHPKVFGPRIDANLTRELADYSRDEPLTVNSVFPGIRIEYKESLMS